MRLTATVPATSANLGPGFDCFGLALDLCNEITIETDAEPSVTWEGEGAGELPTDGSDLVSRALAETAGRFERVLSPMSIRGRNRIPLVRGLGSSAAAAVGGVALADAALGLGLDPTTLLEIAAGIEGHPDNAAAAVFGGFTMVVDERVVARFDPDPELRPALFVPADITISTEDAFAMARRAAREDGIFSGPSTGANLSVALGLARELGEGKRVATVQVDSGLKYLAGEVYG